MIDAVGVADQRIGEAAELDEPMPIGVVARQARDLEAKHEADVGEGDFGGQPGETRSRDKAGGKQGVPQGGVISPLLSNIYLTEVDRMLERAKEATRYGKYTSVEYARFADDLVILIDAHQRHDWLMAAVEKRLREELAELQVEINEEKSRIVDLCRGESFGFLGFDFRRVRSLRGVWRAHYTPKLKKRTALLRKPKDVFRRHQPSEPVDLRARNRKDFGWRQWSRGWMYQTLKLFNGYRVVRPTPKAAPAG